jgi:hypothetical protein
MVDAHEGLIGDTTEYEGSEPELEFGGIKKL